MFGLDIAGGGLRLVILGLIPGAPWITIVLEYSSLSFFVVFSPVLHNFLMLFMTSPLADNLRMPQ